MAHFRKPYADFVARMRVPFGFVLVVAFACLSAPTPWSLMIGLPMSALGLALRAWAAGHLAKNRELATDGPYAYLRNPLYVGTMVVAAGLVAASRQWVLAVLFAAVFLLAYLPVVELEEQHLRNLFPAYAEYARRVPAFVPKLTGARLGARFRFQLYLQNQEYQALAGFLAGALFLVWKTFR